MEPKTFVDTKVFKTLKVIIVCFAVMCIPIMYSFFYLKSYWDPYGRLKNMTIAMVNLDTGSEDGENLGQDFIDALVEKDVVDIKQVDQETAEKGLIDEKYFAVITVPENFTEYLNSASSTDKHIATIKYSPNQKYNYLASQIINKVVTAAETTLESQVSEKVVETLTENLQEIPESLAEIDDGADQLLDGSNKLSDGLSEINNGVGTLQNNYTEFNNGVNSAYTGSQTLTDGIGKVNSGVGTLSTGANTLDSAIDQINTGANTLETSANAGITKLVDGINQVASGTNTLATGTNTLAEKTPTLAAGASQLATGASTLNAGVTQYVDTVNSSVSNIVNTLTLAVQADPTLVTNPYIAGLLATDTSQLATSGEQLKAGASSLSTNIETLNAGVAAVNDAVVNQLNPGAQALNSGVSQLASQETTQSLNALMGGVTTLKNALSQVKDGTTTLKTGVGTLSSGTNQLQTGSQTLTNGLATLNDASGKVNNALATLKDGTQSAYNGSLELKDGIQTLKDGVSDGIDDANKELLKLDGLSDFVKNSVEIEEVDYGEIEAYGTAFTPLFISVGLWVGALMSYVTLYYDPEKRFKIFGKDAKNRYLQSFFYLLMAIAQGLVTGFLLQLGLDLNITNYGLYYGSCVAIAVAFMSIIQFLILNFGEVGKMLGLLILVLQLASCGGTFPVALIDEGFQKLTPYLPMTYTIKLTKEAVIQNQPGNVGELMKILAVYTVVAVAITFIVQKSKRIYKDNKLKKDEEIANQKC